MGEQAADQSILEHRTEFRSVLKQSMVDIFRIYQEHLEDLEGKLREAEEKYEESKSSVTKIQQKEKDTQEKYSSLQDKYDALEHKYDEANREVTKLNTRLASGCKKCRGYQQQMIQQSNVYQQITQMKDNLIKTFEQQLMTYGQGEIGTKVKHQYKSRLKNLESQLTETYSQTSQSEGSSQSSNREASDKKSTQSEETLQAEASHKKSSSVSFLSQAPNKDEDNKEEEAVILVAESKPETSGTSPVGTKLKLTRGEKRTRYQEEPLLENKKSRTSDEHEKTAIKSSLNKSPNELPKTSQQSLSRVQKDMKVMDRPDITVPETVPMDFYSDEDSENSLEDSRMGSKLNPEVIDSQESNKDSNTLKEQNQNTEVTQSEVTSPVFDGKGHGTSKSLQSPSLFDSSSEIHADKKLRKVKPARAVITLSDSPVGDNSPSVLSGEATEDVTKKRSKLSKRARSVPAYIVEDRKYPVEMSDVRVTRKYRQSTLSQAFDVVKPRPKNAMDYNGEIDTGLPTEEQEEVFIQRAKEESLRTQTEDPFLESEIQSNLMPLVTSTPHFKRPATPKRPSELESLSPPPMNGSIAPDLQLTGYEGNNGPIEMQLEPVSLLDIEEAMEEEEKVTSNNKVPADEESVASAVFGGPKAKSTAPRTPPPDSCPDVFDSQSYPKEGARDDIDDSFDVVPKAPSNIPSYPHVEVVRKKSERAKLSGWACKECEQYYDKLGLGEEEKQSRLKNCRHKARFAPPPDTPEHYWEVDFPNTQECQDRGYLNVTQAKPSKARRRRPLQRLFKPKVEKAGRDGGEDVVSDISD